MRAAIRIGVIVSTYNSPNYLRRVLAGLAAQSRLPDEVLVADDGSTGETAEVVREFSGRFSFPVRHVWHDDLGFRLAEIRNRAIAEATADYLLFTDGDCIPHPRFVEDHSRLCRPGCFVTGKRILISRELAPVFRWQGGWHALLHGLRGGLSGIHHLLRLPWLAVPRRTFTGLRGCNMAMFRSDLLAVNGFNERITGWGREDSEIVARLFAFGLHRFETPFAALVLHLWHPENSRASLNENDRLLKETVASRRYWCHDGILKHSTSETVAD